MKYLKYICCVIFILSLFACVDGTNGTNGVDGTNGIDGVDGTNGIDGTNGTDGTNQQTVIISDPGGYVEAASCLGYSAVDLFTMNSNLKQIKNYRGYTNADNTGKYKIPADITELYGQYSFEGYCRRETTTGTVDIKMMLITSMSSENKNLNYPGTIQSFVALDYYNDSEHPDYGNIGDALTTAKAEVLAFFDMPSTIKDFSEMSLQGGTIDDAVMALISATIDFDKNGPEQSNFIKQIAEAIVNDDTVLKAEINAITVNLPIISTKNNIDNLFIELGVEAKSPPIWNLGVPDYYADLLERTPAVQGSFNLAAGNSGCSFDQSTFNTFAVPYVFQSWNDTSKYLAYNLPADAQVSIWTKGMHANGHFAPAVEVQNLETLNEIILDSPETLSYNGMLDLDNMPVVGTEYYLVIRKDEDWVLSKSCTGEMLPFGYILASDDEMENWIGDGNGTPWFNRSGIKSYGVD